MMKGYLTLYLSLTLTALLGFILLLIGGVLRNQNRLQFECAADISMHSVLAEYNRELLMQYDLFFVDASYGNNWPGQQAVEDHLKWYLTQNLEEPETITDLSINSYTAASDGQGNVVKKQIVYYARANDFVDQDAHIRSYGKKVEELETRQTAEEWDSLQETIAGMERPWRINKMGIKEFIEPDHPADVVYGRRGESLIAYTDKIGTGYVDTSGLLSHRIIHGGANPDSYTLDEEEEYLVQSYLFTKYGYLGQEKAGSVLEYEMEYLIAGRESDSENLRQVINRLFQCRFADNAEFSLSDAGLRGKAEELVHTLEIVQYDEKFMEPITQSVLYACAYLESVGDICILLQGGRIPLQKGSGSFRTTIQDVSSNTVSINQSGEGLSYQKYLALFLQNMDRQMAALHMMDVMEMNVRNTSGNDYFQIDWCIQNFSAQLSILDRFGSNYRINRKYGYY